MQILQNKNIVLGITGGIAAYKTPELVRRLKDHGANVRTVVTQSAKEFVTPLSLQAVSGNPVSDSLLDPAAELAMGHIELAKWADLLLIAPATANTIAKLSHGLADDLLSTIYLATDAPVAIAPAMNQQMWHAEVTQKNVNSLVQSSIHLFGPAQGEQACGDVGFGRMLEVPDIVAQCCQLLNPEQRLSGQHFVITAGPTREAIDPVRYISNHSSGKMGYAIAQAAIEAGAKVTLISGPVNIKPPTQCNIVNVESASEMYEQSMALAKTADVFIACAAVADYRVAEIANNKIKKSKDSMQIELVKNPDIVANVAALAEKPFTVGFAAETQDIEKYARGKLARKNLDLIAANDVSIPGQGFNSNDNALTLYTEAKAIKLPLASKIELARQLIAAIVEIKAVESK